MIGKVIEVVKGGLILDLGVRGFLPASLVDIRRVQDLDEFLGQELRCKVIELNRSRNNVVLSRRAVLEDERKEQRQQILDRLNPGDVVDGQISNIVDFGAFVDLDGMDGLIHISELSWWHVNHPSEVLEIGQDVKVKVLDIDRERQRISLGLKQTQSDPWQQVLETYQEGDTVEGTVTKVVTFGAFVEILPGVEGLVHISELAQHHVENPREIVSQGDLVEAKILEVDAERRRLSLSLKRVEGGGVTQRADDSEPVEGTPALELSEEVFPEGGAVEETEPGIEEPAAEESLWPRSLSPRRRSTSRSRPRKPTPHRGRSGRPRRAGPRRPRGRAARAAGRGRDRGPARARDRARPRVGGPPARRRHHGRHRSGEERGARLLRAPRCRDRLQRPDRPPAAARGRRRAARPAGALRRADPRRGRPGRPQRDRRDRLSRPRGARLARAAPHPLVVREYLDWPSSSAACRIPLPSA